MTREEEAAAIGAIAVVGAPGYYVTKLGEVFSGKSKSGPLRRLRPGRHTTGYSQYGLMIDGKARTMLAHQIVARAFLPPRPSGEHVVRHINGDPTDSRADNLAWGTQKENIHDKWTHGTMAVGNKNGAHTKPHRRARGSRAGGAKLDESQVIEIKRRLAAGAKGSHLAVEFGVLKTTISAIKNGRNWRHLPGDGT